MKKNVLIISMIISLTISNYAFANDLEELEFASPENAEYRIAMRGYFSKSGNASPNEIIFSYKSGHREISIGFWAQFLYSGRTGDKTFEIIYSLFQILPSAKPIRELKKEKLNLFFEENSLCPLSFMNVYSGCSRDEKTFLKMIKLQGNQLEFQIILPNCLKR
jgi:hypothetical protein